MACLFTLIGRSIGLALAATFVMAISSAVWAVNFQTTALDSSTYVDTFAEQNAYENLVPLILPALTAALAEDGRANPIPGTIPFEDIINNIDQDDWQEISREVIPPEYLQTEAERNLTVFFEFANGERRRLEMSFSTGTLRGNLLGTPGEQMINQLYTALEPCSQEQESQLQRFLDGEAGVDFPYCKPDSPDLQRQTFGVLSDAKNELANDLPDVWNVRERRAEAENISLNEVDQRFYEEIQVPAVLYRQLAPLAFLLPSASWR
ncbi:MAG: hypothetical protein HC915_05820 [Anaerolineae bacterium]|nr:hypothetical protein [Anaerolineae bacterium]